VQEKVVFVQVKQDSECPVKHDYHCLVELQIKSSCIQFSQLNEDFLRNATNLMCDSLVVFIELGQNVLQ
jgi:hypothetical protein